MEEAPDVPATNAMGKQAHQRISKACQRCRRRKIRCDGTPTCKNCEHTSAICNYRSTTRVRKPTKLATIAQQQEQSSSLLETQQNSNSPTEILRHQQQLLLSGEPQANSERSRTVRAQVSNVYSNVLQTQDIQPSTAGINHSISASCILQLYYGASSNFSFFQQIHHSLSGAANPSKPRSEVDEGGVGPDLYGQRYLFFGTPNSSYQPNVIAGISPLTFLSDQLAESFLQDYLNTIYNLHPFQPSHELRKLLKLLYEKPQTGNITNNETAILMVVLAIGATMTKNTAWAEMLAEKAKNIINTLGHVVNLQAVQLSLLLIRNPPVPVPNV